MPSGTNPHRNESAQQRVEGETPPAWDHRFPPETSVMLSEMYRRRVLDLVCFCNQADTGLHGETVCDCEGRSICDVDVCHA